MAETQDTTPVPDLPIGRNVKIGFFHLGSGMADVITTGVWNRIMINDLGLAATPVGLLIGLRYFLAPLGIWAGRISDQRVIGGYRRLFWVWLGRLLMVLSVFAVGWQTADLARGAPADLDVWLVLSLALLAFSFGSAVSGSNFLALIYDRAGPSQRGRAVGVVWTFLLLGFTLGGIVFSVALPSEGSGEALTPDTLWNLFLVAGLVMGSLWFFSLLGEEKRQPSGRSLAVNINAEGSTSLRADLALVWKSRAMRYFFWYLSLSMAFAFSQDLILEPFGGEVFGMDASTTTRFTAYWGSMSILGTIVCLWLPRRYPRLTNIVLSRWGVVVLIAAFAAFALSSLAEIRPLVTPGLILLGVGLGLWNVGTLSLMMDMSPLGKAGTFLGFWTLVVTFSRGIGVAGSGPILDLTLALTENVNLAYGAVFAVGAVGLAVSLVMLRQVSAARMDAAPPVDAAQALAGAMD
jgi:BCD family chlorophyll transporter-like MFS transporter